MSVLHSRRVSEFFSLVGESNCDKAGKYYSTVRRFEPLEASCFLTFVRRRYQYFLSLIYSDRH